VIIFSIKLSHEWEGTHPEAFIDPGWSVKMTVTTRSTFACVRVRMRVGPQRTRGWWNATRCARWPWNTVIHPCETHTSARKSVTW